MAYGEFSTVYEELFEILVDVEYNNRKSNSLRHLIKGAGFNQPEAYIGDINYISGRKLSSYWLQQSAVGQSVAPLKIKVVLDKGYTSFGVNPWFFRYIFSRYEQESSLNLAQNHSF